MSDAAGEGTAKKHESDETETRQARRWPWVVGGVIVLALGIAVLWVMTRPEERAAKPPPPPPLARSAIAEPAETLTIRQTGFVRPEATLTVAAEIGGRIADVGSDFEVGNFIEEGALLIRLETTRIEADIASAEAAVAQSEAALAEARIERDRQEELEEKDFAAEAVLQQAIVAVATAEADLTAARATLTQAREQLEDATITAPFAALVTEESAAEGALVQAGASLGTLVSAEAAEIELGLTPPDLRVLGEAERAIGGRVILRDPAVPDAVLATGEVVRVDGDIAPETRTVGLIVRVATPFEDGEDRARPLRVDELVALELPVDVEDRGVLAVPPEAVKGRGTLWTIEEGRLARRQVTVLQRAEDRVLIGGAELAAGTRVMLSDLPGAVDGQEVRIEREGAAGDGS
ncbi:efflux RND transporter periplasmic adaptor subunit [Roseovarius aquimarinus]|uniref:Efflux RND transporter periplasmic adaptor subunit n=1 Tax=Roseovarius aquimarinus TaxID=1229156 RepID=A0ABW7I4B9_9RHOB